MKQDFDYNKLTPEQKKQAQELKKTAEKYRGKSEKELFAELERIRNSDGGKNITPAKMRAFRQKVAPMLTPEQKRKLDSILGRLEKENSHSGKNN